MTFKHALRFLKTFNKLLFFISFYWKSDAVLVCKAHWADPRTGTVLYKTMLLLFIIIMW